MGDQTDIERRNNYQNFFSVDYDMYLEPYDIMIYTEQLKNNMTDLEKL